MELRTKLSLNLPICMYNSIDDGSNLTRVAEHLSKAIDSNSHFNVDKIIQALVMDAINHLKNNRSNPVNDCLKRIICHMRATINVI